MPLDLSSPVLDADGDQLASQLIARLAAHERDMPAIAALLCQARAQRIRPWLCPAGASLTPPGGPLLRRVQFDLASALACADGDVHVLVADHTPVLCDMRSGKVVRRFELPPSDENHGAYFTAVAFTCDGAQVLAGSNELAFVRWDRHTGALLHSCRGSGIVSTMTLCGDGERALTGGHNGEVELWVTQTGALLRTLAATTGRSGRWRSPTMACWVCRRARARTVSDCGISRPATSCVRSPAAARQSDGTRLVSTSDDAAVKVWNAHSRALVQAHRDPRRDVLAVSITADGARALSSSGDRVELWDPGTGHEQGSVRNPADRERTCTAVLNRAGTLLATGHFDGTVGVFDDESGPPLWEAPGLEQGSRANIPVESGAATHGHQGRVERMSFSRDGTQLLTVATRWNARVWDARTGRIECQFGEPARRVSAASFSGDGARLITIFLVDGDSGQRGPEHLASLWDMRTGALLATIEAAGPVNRAVVTSDGTSAFLGLADGSIGLWDTQSGELTRGFVGHAKPIVGLSLGDDETRLLSGSRDGTLRLWDVPSGRLLSTIFADGIHHPANHCIRVANPSDEYRLHPGRSLVLAEYSSRQAGTES